MMADETIRKLFDKMDEIVVQVTRMEVLLSETVLTHLDKVDDRLDRHRQDLTILEKRIHEIEDTKKMAISMKKLIAGILGLVAMSVSIAAGVIQLMK